MTQPPRADEVLQMVSPTPAWHQSASKIGNSVGLLAHRIWISLVEWCDGRTLHGATLEQMQLRVPLRYLYGSTSGKYHASNQAAIAHHPAAEAAGVAGAGHFMLSEEPAATLAALKRLLADLVGGDFKGVGCPTSEASKRDAGAPVTHVASSRLPHLPHALTDLPHALTGGASVVKALRTAAPRVWGNKGQASVALLTLTLSNGESRHVVWKHSKVAPREKGPSGGGSSKAVADMRLASFEAEAAFFSSCSARMAAHAPVPTAWSVSHSWQSREFTLLMSNLMADGFQHHPSELHLGRARRALEWCAALHAEYWGGSTPEGLWHIGSYYNLAKTGGCLSPDRMRRHLATFSESHASLVPRLFNAAVPLDWALHGQGMGQPTGSGVALRRAPKRRAAAVSGTEDEEDAPAVAVRLPLHRTLVHGDLKCENLFFREDDTCAACDFQWAGRGVGSLDVVYLLTTSLADGLMSQHEATLLRHYHDALCRRLEQRATSQPTKPSPPPPSWAEIELEYSLATLDFARFVLADAPLIETDVWLLERTATLLTRLDGGTVLSTAAYAKALNACADAAGEPNSTLTGIVR